MQRTRKKYKFIQQWLIVELMLVYHSFNFDFFSGMLGSKLIFSSSNYDAKIVELVLEQPNFDSMV